MHVQICPFGFSFNIAVMKFECEATVCTSRQFMYVCTIMCKLNTTIRNSRGGYKSKLEMGGVVVFEMTTSTC